MPELSPTYVMLTLEIEHDGFPKWVRGGFNFQEVFGLAGEINWVFN